jgi:o-succinylbenzoate---CoA ligase
LVPTALRRIDAARFRVIVLGGTRPPADRPANTIATYGMTESGSGIVYDGRPLDGVDVSLDADGRIRVRGPMMLRAYRLDNAAALGADGWFDTGDVGRWLDDGRLHVDGRVGDVIVTGGEKVWPDAVEAALAPFGEIAIAGIPDAEWGQAVAAFVARGAATAPTLAQLRDAVKAVLPAYAAPRILRVVEVLPRTPLGKIQRHLLANSHGE